MNPPAIRRGGGVSEQFEKFVWIDDVYEPAGVLPLFGICEDFGKYVSCHFVGRFVAK